MATEKGRLTRENSSIEAYTYGVRVHVREETNRLVLVVVSASAQCNEANENPHVNDQLETRTCQPKIMSDSSPEMTSETTSVSQEFREGPASV